MSKAKNQTKLGAKNEKNYKFYTGIVRNVVFGCFCKRTAPI